MKERYGVEGSQNYYVLKIQKNKATEKKREKNIYLAILKKKKKR